MDEAPQGAPRARTGHVQLWTPFGFFVWGGSNANGVLTDGALFDPCTRKWTTVSDPGLSPRSGVIAGWSSLTEEVIIYGGNWASPIHSLTDGAAYKPKTRTWRKIAINRFGDERYGVGTDFLIGYTGAMAGGKLAIYGGFPNHGKVSNESYVHPAVYDPVSDTWTELPHPAMSPGFAGLALSSGANRATFIGRIAIDACPLGDGAEWDVSTNAWRYIAPEGITRTEGAAFYGDGRLYRWGGDACDFTPVTGGASYDYATATWTALPAGGPTTRSNGFWTGDEGILWGTTDGAIYRP